MSNDWIEKKLMMKKTEKKIAHDITFFFITNTSFANAWKENKMFFYLTI